MARVPSMLPRRLRFEGCTVMALAVVLWIVVVPATVPDLFFPGPLSVLRAITELRWLLLWNSLATLCRAVVGLLIGTAFGTVVGLLMTRSPAIYRTVRPPLELLRPLPPVALVPFFILWFGVGSTGQITLTSLACFMIVTITTYQAVQTVPSVYLQAAATLGASPRRIYFTVLLPAISPILFAGFRVAAGVAFGVAVAAEFIGAQSGLGYMIMVARRTLNTNTILLGIALLGLESFAVDSVIRLLALRMTRWLDAPATGIMLIADL